MVINNDTAETCYGKLLLSTEGVEIFTAQDYDVDNPRLVFVAFTIVYLLWSLYIKESYAKLMDFFYKLWKDSSEGLD